MSNSPPTSYEHRIDAERLIELARGLLNRPDEEMVVLYLDHAVKALHMVEELDLAPRNGRSSGLVNCSAMAPVQDHG